MSVETELADIKVDVKSIEARLVIIQVDVATIKTEIKTRDSTRLRNAIYGGLGGLIPAIGVAIYFWLR